MTPVEPDAPEDDPIIADEEAKAETATAVDVEPLDVDPIDPELAAAECDDDSIGADDPHAGAPDGAVAVIG